MSNLINQTFGELTVIAEHPVRINRSIAYECECSCGTMRTVEKRYLTSGRIKHCGSKKLHQSNYKKTNNPVFPVAEHVDRWKNIKRRCYDPSYKQYHDYGGRGIAMYNEWVNSSIPFIEWINNNLGPCPANHTLDRINVNGNYEPGNLRWVNHKVQQNNKRK